MQYILILLFFFISISSLSAKDYLCDLKSSNPKIKWDQINNWEYTEVPFTYPGSIGSYVISINQDNIEINSFKFEDNFYESQKTWSDNYIENLFNDIFYKEREDSKTIYDKATIEPKSFIESFFHAVCKTL